MTMYKTLLLDRSAWDLVLDSNGDIASASPPYALAQDVASAIKLFLGELWYDTTKGVPYFENVLGKLPPASLLASLIEKAALTVSGVVSAQCSLNPLENGLATGQLAFIDERGSANAISF